MGGLRVLKATWPYDARKPMLIPLSILAAITLATPLSAVHGRIQSAAVPEGTVLLQRFIRAVGGEAAIRDVQSMSASGQIDLPGSDESGQFSWAVADGGRCVFDMTFPNLGQSTFGTDGLIGWESLTLGNTNTVQQISLSTIESRRRRSNWFELALTLPARARSFDTIGLSTFDGTAAFEIRMVDETDRIHHVFFDSATNLLLGVRLIERGPLGPADVTIRFSNWKPVESLLLFHTVSIDHADVHLRLQFDQVSLQDVPQDRFTPPSTLKTTPPEKAILPK
jgi:hypothetical protein